MVRLFFARRAADVGFVEYSTGSILYIAGMRLRSCLLQTDSDGSFMPARAFSSEPLRPLLSKPVESPLLNLVNALQLCIFWGEAMQLALLAHSQHLGDPKRTFIQHWFGDFPT